MPGRIGFKSIEIDAGQMPLTGNVISMDLHLNSTGQIPLTGNVISMNFYLI